MQQKKKGEFRNVKKILGKGILARTEQDKEHLLGLISQIKFF